MDISDRNDGESSRVFSSRHPKVIRWDDGESRIIEDAPDGDGVADACEGRSHLDPCSRRALPHGGRQLSWFRQQIFHRGRVWQFVEGGEHGRAIRDGGSTSLPSFRSRNGGKTLRATIIHYMATSA
jgi:hypothetical protein